MPKNQFQRMIFALITVVITVCAYVFYSLFVVNGNALMSGTGESSVLAAIHAQGGVYMFGHMLPIWALILIEFCFAYTLECTLGSPMSFKLACKNFNPKETHPVLFESVVICSTVVIMVPAMSFLATLFYYPYYNGFSFLNMIASWLRLMCYNLPFAFFTQLFFIQPFVRRVFKLIFAPQKETEKAEKEEVIPA